MDSTVAYIPPEISLEIFSHLSIKNLRNVIVSSELSPQSNASIGTSSQCTKRIDEMQNPLRYFGTMFSDPQKLLYELGKVGTMLSGSRALDYFLKGSATETSDWDFYCPPSLISIYGTMKALEKSGVVWKSVYEVMQDALQKQSNQDVIAYLRRTHPNIEISRLLNRQDTYAANLSTELIEDIMIVIDGNTYDTEQCKTISGTITKGDVSHGVQIIYSTGDDSPTEMILQFHSSVVQCFMGFHGAGHLYYRPTMKKIAYYWGSNTRQYGPALFNKYLERGFRYMRFNTDVVVDDYENIIDDIVVFNETVQDDEWYTNIYAKENIRTLGDNISKFISFDQYYDHDLISAWLKADSQNNIHGMSEEWHTYNYMYWTAIVAKSLHWHQLPSATVKRESLIAAISRRNLFGPINPLDLYEQFMLMGRASVMSDIPDRGSLSITAWIQNYLTLHCHISRSLSL